MDFAKVAKLAQEIAGMSDPSEKERPCFGPISALKRIEMIGDHAQELGRIDVLHEQQLDELARVLRIARRRANT